MRRVADDPLGLDGIDVRILEQPELELRAQHRPQALVEQRLGNGSLANELQQRRVAVGVRQLDVDARPDGERRRLLRVVREVVAVQLGALVQLADREVVRHHEAAESPLLPQDLVEQPAVGVRRDPVDLVVGGHDAQRAPLDDRAAERGEEDVAQHPHRDVDRGAVRPGLRLAVRREVLHRGDQVPLVAEPAVSLEAADGRHAHAADEVRILAEGLLGAPPPRVARDVEVGRQRLVRAARAGLGGDGGVHALHQAGVEGGRQADRLREARPLARRVAVQALLVEHHRDPQPRLFDEEALDRVGGLGHLPRGEPAGQVARPGHLPQAVPVAEAGAGRRLVETPVCVHEAGPLPLPRAHHLRDLLLERHPPQEVLHPLVHRPRPVLVQRHRIHGSLALVTRTLHGAPPARRPSGLRGACRSRRRPGTRRRSRR